MIFYKYYCMLRNLEVLKIPARNFKRQHYSNTSMLTVIDGCKVYAWTMTKKENAAFEKLWTADGIIVVKKFYDKDKVLIKALLSLKS